MTPRRCRHPFAARHTHIAHVEIADFDEPQPMIYERCANCGAWLPLGPSSESEPEVAVEIRAAEIATDLADKGCTMSSLEVSGFNEEPMRLRNGVPIELDTASQRSGYLARCIATHEEEGE